MLHISSLPKTTLLSAMVSIILLGGCDGLTAMKYNDKIDLAKQSVERDLPKVRGEKETQVKNDPLEVSDNVWAGSQAMRMRRGQPLPKAYEGNKGIILISATPLPLDVLARQISATTGVPVRLSDDLTPATNTSTAGDQNANTNAMPISYEGPLSGLLDQIGGHFGVSWRFDGSTVILYKYETRTFIVEALPGTQTVTDGLSSGESGGSSGGSTGGGGGSSADATQDSEMKIDLAIWDELNLSIQNIVESQGKFSVAPTSGTITVITTPDRMRRVAEYLQGENGRLSKQIAIELSVYSVTLSNVDDYGLSFESALRASPAYTGAGAGFGVVDGVPGSTFLGGGSALSSGAGLAGAANPVTSASAGSLSFAVLGKNWNASTTVKALSTIGKVAVVTRMPVTTLNNRPASRKIATDKTYLASVATTTTDGVSQSSLTPGTVSTGITLQMMPRLLGDGRIMLQYSLKLSDLISISSFSSGGNSIQTPEVSSKVFVQQAMLNSGSTLILAGYEQDDNRGSQQGTGTPSNWLFGGGVNNSQAKTLLVLSITPREVDIRASEVN